VTLAKCEVGERAREEDASVGERGRGGTRRVV